MNNYTVYFLEKNIISIEVSAENEKYAKEKAEKILNKERRKGIDIVDGITEFAGFTNADLWDEIND